MSYTVNGILQPGFPLQPLKTSSYQTFSSGPCEASVLVNGGPSNSTSLFFGSKGLSTVIVSDTNIYF